MNLNEKLKRLTPERHGIYEKHAVKPVTSKVFEKVMYDQMYKYSWDNFVTVSMCISNGITPLDMSRSYVRKLKFSLHKGSCCGIPPTDLLKARDSIMYHLWVVVAILVLFRNMRKEINFFFIKPSNTTKTRSINDHKIPERRQKTMGVVLQVRYTRQYFFFTKYFKPKILKTIATN